MAATGIWKIKKRLDHVIDYISNPEKTTKSTEDYFDLHKFSEYEDLDFNSEEECFISGINCLVDCAYEDMMSTKSYWKKKDGILGFHAFQSFKENEVTPSQAHLIGVRLANEMWGDKYEVVVATHKNTNHIHNHFVINSVSFKDGKKYNDCNESYAMLRQLSDSLCEEYNLSVIDNTKSKKSKVNYENYYKKIVKNNTYYSTTKKDIDHAIGMAYSYKDFENILNKMGYEIKNRYGKLSVRRNPYKKNIRIERAFGSDYSIENISKRVEREFAIRVPFIEAYNPKNNIKATKEYKREKAHGLYGLYKYYCYILKTYPKKYPNKILIPALRVEVDKLEEISKQTQLLVSEKIETYEQLLFYKDNLNQNIKELSSKRENLWKKIKRTDDINEKMSIRNEIEIITKKLANERKKVVLCEAIEKRTNVVEENIKEFEKDNGKDVMKK